MERTNSYIPLEQPTPTITTASIFHPATSTLSTRADLFLLAQPTSFWDSNFIYFIPRYIYGHTQQFCNQENLVEMQCIQLLTYENIIL